ncbi:hypothetical protein [Siminovitchia sp. 179-K 8D1 HS]|uniref:hypothetical protein n=1 Tax=Siminovitchia sp. 179-K 8D1 HS TaxID=3142385 RepID=UPI0039A03A51
MEKYFMLTVIIVGFLVSITIARKEKDENSSLTKKGFMKLMGLFAIIFILAVIFVAINYRQ